MQRNGHTSEIVTDTWKTGRDTVPNSSRVVAEESYLREIRVLLDHSKGKELPGTFTPLLVGELFINQSKHWKGIAMGFAERVWNLVKRFLDDVLVHVADESVRQAILEKIIDPAMDERLALLREKVGELHSPYAGGYPATLNPRFGQKLEDQWRASDQQAEETQQSQQAQNEIDDDDPDTHACRELLYLMQAYYAVALDVFVDNVANLGVENCLMNGLKNLLSPRAVSEMDDEMLDAIAFESEDVCELRNQTVEKLSSLQKSFDLCRRQAGKLSLAERDSEIKNAKSPSATTEAVAEPFSNRFSSITISSPGKSNAVTNDKSAPSPRVNNLNPGTFGSAAVSPSRQAVFSLFASTLGQPSTVRSQNSGKSVFGVAEPGVSNPDSKSGKSSFGNPSGFSESPSLFGTQTGVGSGLFGQPSQKKRVVPFQGVSQGKAAVEFSYLKEIPTSSEALSHGKQISSVTYDSEKTVMHHIGVNSGYSPEEIRLKDYQIQGRLA